MPKDDRLKQLIQEKYKNEALIIKHRDNIKGFNNAIEVLKYRNNTITNEIQELRKEQKRITNA